MKKVLNSSFIAVLVCLVMGLTFSSCKKESDAEKSYTGKWEIKKVSNDGKTWEDVTSDESISLHSNKKVTATGAFGMIITALTKEGIDVKWKAEGKVIDVYATQDKKEANVWTMTEIDPVESQNQTFKITVASDNKVTFIQALRSDL